MSPLWAGTPCRHFIFDWSVRVVMKNTLFHVDRRLALRSISRLRWLFVMVVVSLAASTQAVAADRLPESLAAPEARDGSQTRAQQLMGDTDPKLAELTDKVLYGDIWERPGLSKRDRSLITVAALVAMNRPDQLRSHLVLAQKNGVTQTEIIETITQMAFYAGWPNAIAAVAVAKDVFKK